MHHNKRFLILLALVMLFSLSGICFASPSQCEPPVTEKAAAILARVSPFLEKKLSAGGFKLGAPVFIRIFKMPGELEVWLEKNGRYALFKSYPICDFSGYPGPKLQEGDWQSPEGFYGVTAEQMNPRSSYHLSFNIGYPNEYDRLHDRSGSNIMVHGNCSSRGCFAMNNYRMEEIYTIAHFALDQGQEAFSVHIFPFRMTSENMNKFQDSPWIRFWENLKEGFDEFEKTRQVPDVHVAEGRYMISTPANIAMQSTNKYLNP